MSDHALYPPSSNYRLIDCPASHMEELAAPPEEPSIYAQRGTFLHSLVPTAYEEGGQAIRGSVSQEDYEQVMSFVDYIKLVKATCSTSAKIHFEKKVYLTPWGVEDQWGTGDVFIDDGTLLHVMDAKFGSTPVYAQDNPQLMAYAAAYTGYPPKHEEFHLHINQPPLNYEGEFVIDKERLHHFIFEVLVPAIEKSQLAEPPYGPTTKACQFCKAAMTCTARYKKQLQNAQKAFAAYQQMPKTTPEMLGKALDAAEEYIAYINKLRTYVLEGLLRGEVRADGWKAVSGRGSRKWQNEANAIEYLENTSVAEDMFVEKLISPAQAEGKNRKFKKDDDFNALILFKPGKPQLVKNENPKPALTPTRDAMSAFKDYIVSDDDES